MKEKGDVTGERAPFPFSLERQALLANPKLYPNANPNSNPNAYSNPYLVIATFSPSLERWVGSASPGKPNPDPIPNPNPDPGANPNPDLDANLTLTLTRR